MYKVELKPQGETMPIPNKVQELTELLRDTNAEQCRVFIGLTNQPVILPSGKGGRKVKRSIHFIRIHSIKPEIWVGNEFWKLVEYAEWNQKYLNVQK